MSFQKMIALLLLLLLPVTLLAACGDSWREDAAAAELAETVSAYLDAGSLAEMKESYLTGAMKLDTALFSDWVVEVNAYGVNIDEFGIFRAPDAAGVSAVENAVRDYLQLRRDTWMDEYMPEEKPKLEKAEVKTCGLYVIYVIASEEARPQMLAAFEQALKV